MDAHTSKTPPARSSHVVKEKDGNYTVFLTQESFSKESLDLTSSGFFLDVFALSAQCWECNEVDENSFDWMHTCTDYALDAFDYEADYIDALNNQKQKGATASMSTKQRKAMFDSDLKHGAFHALNNPEQFAKDLQAYEDHLREQARECTGDYSTDSPELNAELLRAYDSAQSDLYHEWLHGDRSYLGMLREAQKYHGFEDVDYTEGTKDVPAELRIEVSEAWILDAFGYADDYKVTKDDASEQVVSTISYRAKQYVEEQRKKRAAWKAERERVAKYQAEQSEARANARIEKLKAMKK